MGNMIKPQVQGVILKFSHEEVDDGRVRRFYICPVCGQLYSFRPDELPEIEECEFCGTHFEGVEFNDQIGG